MAIAKLLLVDDDDVVLYTLSKVLEQRGFEIDTAGSVSEALRHITTQTYDVLLSDLHMPGPGDGLTVVSAMRHANPKAITVLLSAYPDTDAGARAIAQQADEILIKPMDVSVLLKVIEQRLANEPVPPRAVESVATILEHAAPNTIQDWYAHVKKERHLMAIPMSWELRCAHIPQLFRDLVYRLRAAKPLGTKDLRSTAAEQHGADRRKQGYTAAMLVDESRILQVSIFQTLQNNLGRIDFSLLLTDVMTIADECDSQLSQSMSGYLAESDDDHSGFEGRSLTALVSDQPD